MRAGFSTIGSLIATGATPRGVPIGSQAVKLRTRADTAPEHGVASFRSLSTDMATGAEQAATAH